MIVYLVMRREGCVWLVRVDVLSMQKHLHYPLIPSLYRPRERHLATTGARLVRIDVLSLQKPRYYPLVPPSSCPRENRIPRAIPCRAPQPPRPCRVWHPHQSLQSEY